MPKHILTLFFLIALPIYSFSQKYAQTTLLGYAHDSGTSIYDIDDEGNAYVGIASRYNINFQGNLFNNHTGSDYTVLSKLNSAGKALWVRDLSDKSYCQIYDLKVDKDHNIYISGAGGNIKLDDGTTLLGGTFLIKLDKNGKTLWGIISENTQANTGGPIALAADGVYWSSSFYDKLTLQGRTLNTNNPNGGSPDAFIARVSANGVVSHLYRDPSLSSIVQILVSSDNGNATAVITRGGFIKGKVLLNNECQVISDEPFLTYADFPPPVYTNSNGYQMIGTVYEQKSYGLAARGFYDIKYDKQLNVTDSVKLFANPPGGRTVYNAIDYNNKGYFLMSPPNPYSISNKQDWIFMDENKVLNILPNENAGAFGDDPITRRFVKVVGDTLHMVIRHLSYYTTSFTFDGKAYSTPSNQDATYFWAKYVYQDPDSCKKVTAKVMNKGLEGSTDIRVLFSLPASCPAEQDIIINTAQAQTSANLYDFDLPQQVIIKKGETEAALTVKVINDFIIESQETFAINLNISANAANYRMSNALLNVVIDDDDNTDANRLFTVNYLPRIKEGEAGFITVALPEGIVSSTPLVINFADGDQTYKAARDTDYLPFSITLPAGTNSIQVSVNTLTDHLIEGDEFIDGALLAQPNTVGNFAGENTTINIKIEDIDNIAENRVFIISPETDVIAEGGLLEYHLQLIPPYKLQRPVNISASPVQWFSALQQPATNFMYNNAGNDITLNYPDDNVIRNDKFVKLFLAANDAHTGNYRFMWKQAFTDTLTVKALDNDRDYLQLSIDPLTLEIPEGGIGKVNIQLAGNRVLENNQIINYKWTGIGVNQDKRISFPNVNVTLPALQNNISVILPVVNNQQVDLFNKYLLLFTLPNMNSGLAPLITNNKVSVDIIDDDGSIANIPNMFTPNGDGKNDTWIIPNLNYDPSCKVSIFNRLGAIVYYSNGYAVAWDGTISGSAAAVGTYYYVINTRNKTLSGTLTIIR